MVGLLVGLPGFFRYFSTARWENFATNLLLRSHFLGAAVMVQKRTVYLRVSPLRYSFSYPIRLTNNLDCCTYRRLAWPCACTPR